MINTTKRRGRPPIAEPTPSQLGVLGAILCHYQREALPPTMQELADMLHMTPASVHEQVKQLEAKGLITTRRRKARSIRIVDSRPAVADALSN